MTTPTTVRALYSAVHAYSGSAMFSDVLSPWLDQHATAVRDLIAPLAAFGQWRRTEYVWGDLLEQMYALSRVNDVLLLGFQSALPAGATTPWAHEMHLPDREVRISAEEYVRFFTALGMRQVDAARFDPFFHEVVAVEQSADPAALIETTGERWPCLMLGEMLFSRAGVGVRAGEQHAVAGIADQSELSEVFLRRYRPTRDGSFGWGSNSQWKTDFRRDYLTDGAYRFNVDEDNDIDADPELAASPLTRAELHDVLRHRCAVRRYPGVPEEKLPWLGGSSLVLPRG
ncbi:hypothetical protein [Amycolatopsis benzoatilytica]|uniref:hypothetical protein n=1 Tax=Amycolatopsis benzoatilytica TaxID=346045 RepID=UPI00038242F1|nr:hypothetical protein [Amycolatopsis benzoatilytica]